MHYESYLAMESWPICPC